MRRYGWIALLSLCGLLMASGAGSRAVIAAPRPQMMSGMDQLSQLSGADFEIAFMSMMIPHHQTAVDMAKLALNQAQHAELQTTAQNIVSSQSSEIADMTNWLQQWYQTAPQARWGQLMEQDMAGMGMMTDMQQLGTLQGAAFDKAFLPSMTMHHAMAVQMAQLVPSRATHAELKTLAQNIIASQSAEIQEFTGWLKTWYNQDMPSMSMGGGMDSGPMGGAMPGSNMGGSTGVGMPQTGQGADPLLTWLLALAGSLLVLGGLLRTRLQRTR